MSKKIIITDTDEEDPVEDDLLIPDVLDDDNLELDSYDNTESISNS